MNSVIKDDFYKLKKLIKRDISKNWNGESVGKSKIEVWLLVSPKGKH